MGDNSPFMLRVALSPNQDDDTYRRIAVWWQESQPPIYYVREETTVSQPSSPDLLTAADLARWRRLVSEATPGPWAWNASVLSTLPDGGWWTPSMYAIEEWQAQDAEFIAVAREALPALLVLVEELQNAALRLAAAAQAVYDDDPPYHERRAALKEAIANVQRAVMGEDREA